MLMTYDSYIMMLNALQHMELAYNNKIIHYMPLSMPQVYDFATNLITFKI